MRTSTTIGILGVAFLIAACAVGCIVYVLTMASRPTAGPEIDVEVAFPDTASEEVESLVVRPIEEALLIEEDLLELRATSRRGRGSIRCAFAGSLERDAALAAVARVVGSVVLPEGAEEPKVALAARASDRVGRWIVCGDLEPSELTVIAEELHKALLAVPDVAHASLEGAFSFRTEIRLDVERLTAFGVGIDAAIRAIRESFTTPPAGTLRGGSTEILMRTVASFRDLNAIVIAQRADGVAIRVGDVARVETRALPPDRSVAVAGDPGIALVVAKRPDADADDVRRALETLCRSFEHRMPPGVRLVRSDPPERIGERVLYVTGPSRSALPEVAQRLAERLGRVDGVRAVHLPERANDEPEYELVPDRSQLARVGLSLEKVLRQIELATDGVRVGSVASGRQSTPVVVAIGERREALEDLVLDASDTGERRRVPLASVAEIRLVRAPGVLHRHNGESAIPLRIEVAQALAERALREVVEEVSLPPGVAVHGRLD